MRPIYLLPLMAVGCLTGNLLMSDHDTQVLSQDPGEHFAEAISDAEFGVYKETDLAVGAPEADKVYVFDGPLLGALLPRRIDTSQADYTFTGVPGSRTGFAMVSANLLGGPNRDLVVSAPWYGDWLGRIYIFEGDGAPGPKLIPTTILEGIQPGDFAGWSLATGDLDGDGHDDLVVGSCGRAGFRGSAYVFLGPIASGATLSMLDADHAVAGAAVADRFGCAVSAGDLDGDGKDELVVGAPIEAYDLPLVGQEPGPTDPRPGAVHVFWDLPATKDFVQNLGDRSRLTGGDSPFIGIAGVGHSVDASGDANGDGYDDLIAGAPQLGCEHVGYLNCEQQVSWGTAYLVLGRAAAPGMPPFPVEDVIDFASNYVFEGGIVGDGVGNTVRFLGDLDGTGRDEIAIGTRRHRTHVWYGNTGMQPGANTQLVFVTDDHLTIDGSAEGRYAGRSLLRLGDLDGDGDDEFAVGGPGASYWNAPGVGKGEVAIFRGRQ